MVSRISWSAGLWIAGGFFDEIFFIPSIFSTQGVSAMFKGRKLHVSHACAYCFDRGKVMLPDVGVIQGEFIMFVKRAEVEVGEMKSLSSTSTKNTKAAKLGKTMRRLIRKGGETFKNIGFKCISPFSFWKVSPSCVEGCLFWDESCV